MSEEDNSRTNIHGTSSNSRTKIMGTIKCRGQVFGHQAFERKFWGYNSGDDISGTKIPLYEYSEDKISGTVISGTKCRGQNYRYANPGD